MSQSPDEIIAKLSFELVKTFERDKERILKNLFKEQIRGSFLMEMCDRVALALGPDFGGVFDIVPNAMQMITTSGESIQYEICCHIVGTHRANMVFKTMTQVRELQRDETYKKQLTKQVVAHIKTRRYGSAHFRKMPMMQGEQFSYFSVPYELFVMSMRANEIINAQETKFHNQFKLISYHAIIGKTFATLSLLGDNFLDSAYPTCRTVIELFAKLLILQDSSDLFEEAALFAHYDLLKNCCTGKYPPDFKKAFARRTNQNCKNMIDYLHFGFLDKVLGYHDIVKQNPYSMIGILKYLTTVAESDVRNMFVLLENLYKQCNGYAHGSAAKSNYPLLHYFEIALSLAIIIPVVYQMICSETGESAYINGIDVPGDCNNNIQLLMEQYAQRSTENFDNYYAQMGHY